jgi:KDO2-lipid IV(A) lauroyltransferase
VQTGDREADIVANTARCNRVLAAQIRERPEEWLWIHRRWKIRRRRDLLALQQAVNVRNG